MQGLRYLIAVAVLASTLPAQAATTDPEVILYRASGVSDGGNGSSVATAFSCTPFSGVTENIRVVVRKFDGTIVANVVQPVQHLNSIVYGTQLLTIYGTSNLSTGLLVGGTVAIAATSTSVNCTAMLIQPNNGAPVGIHLHLTRFSPLAGTSE